MAVVVVMAAMNVHHIHAQRSPVGIASMQDSVKSVQFGLISATAISQMKGCQLGGFAAMAAAPINGFQFSGISNIAMGVEKGLQLASLFNVSAGDMHGVQTSLYNFSDSLSGVQIGLLNRSISQTKGVQVGLINISRDSVGHQVGLFNVNPKTTIDYMLYGGNVNKINFGVRLRNRHSYSILSFGTHYMGLDRKFSGALSYRW